MAGRRLPELDDLIAATIAPDGHVQAGTLPKRPRRLNGAFSACLYVLAGFICGAVFWHFIGFWSTFHDILVRGPAREAAVPHLVAQTGQSCTALVLDRDHGVTRAEACAPSNIELAEATNYRRDRMTTRPAMNRPTVADTNWTVTIKDKPTVDATANSAAPEDGIVSPATVTPN